MATAGSDVWSRYRDWLVFALALLCALVLRYIDTHTDDTQFAFFALVGFSFILGAIHPARAWLSGLIVGMGVGLPQLLGAAGIYPSPYPVSVVGAFVIMAIGVAAGYAGKMTRDYLQPNHTSQ